MHRCLLIPEIVCLICAEIGTTGAKRSLVNFAQSCLAFSEPALDALWYMLQDLLPLVQCMPRDLWSIGQGKNLKFQRPIVPTDWERFVYHAERVREFIYYDNGDIGAWHVFQTLNLGSTRELLLPNLRGLWWDVGEENGFVFPCIRLFLGPHIRRLHVSTEGMSGPEKFIRLSLLHTLVSQYPSLPHLHLIDDTESQDGADLVDSISHVVCGWTQLHQLSVRALSSQALRHVAILPTLESLALTNVTEDILLPPFSRSSTVSFFPCLQKLEVTCDVTSFAIGLLEVISSSALASISIASYHLVQSGYQDLINALRDYCSRLPLKSISICGDFDHLSFPTLVDVQPLLVFADLTHIELECFHVLLELDDTSLKDMALAWPHITSLILIGSSHVTLSGLVSLAQYCLKLQHLNIFFDPCSLPHRAIEFSAVKNEVLRNMDVSYHPVSFSPITAPERVAAFIHGVFPRARLIVRSDSKWVEVAATVHAYLERPPQMMNVMSPGMSHHATTQQFRSMEA